MDVSNKNKELKNAITLYCDSNKNPNIIFINISNPKKDI